MTAVDDQQQAADTLEVSVFRYSADPPATGNFLQQLGLSPRISNDAGSWLELQAAHGSVSLHATGAAGRTEAEPGVTDLVLVARDVPAFVEGLSGQDGVEVQVWDEAFGHQAAVTRGGRRVIINEIQPDPYGYHVTEPTPGPVSVVCHCWTGDDRALRDLLLALGLRQSSASSEGTVRLETGSAGVVVLHHLDGGDERYELGLETDDDLDQLAERLRVAGHRPDTVRDGRLVVTDPDGCEVAITGR